MSISRWCYFLRGPAHSMMAVTSAASIRKLLPEAIIEAYSDDAEAIAFLKARGIDTVTIPRGMPLMLANLEAQARAIYEESPGDVIAFIDADTIVRAIPKLDERADIGVTWRDRESTLPDGKPYVGVAATMPYNYGVILARGSFAATESFIWMRERIRRMSHQMQDWYGNQLALAALCGQRPASGVMLDARRIPATATSQGNQIWIEKLPCTAYNYTPGAAGEDLKGRFILHFKGKSRALMREYAREQDLPWLGVKAEAA
jgi:hypothetical protein